MYALTGLLLTGKFRPHGAVQIERQRQNAHEGAVAVVIDPDTAAFQWGSTLGVFDQCLPEQRVSLRSRSEREMQRKTVSSYSHISTPQF